ncbi:hypothetical protein EDM56_28980 [Brevibacillus fluminis]|uniref:Uncharacterized protein n=1 Tax=Brevibacillus fluminis TaxID=511487 RepID=A0A3M8CW24_9BACL|nr:GerAB/ArcD/ProY family transporter [Brevibacillus fluminis]RNB79561.1 hypothetical protein EDM56_28980 [Brevibacillus fluminis]
MIKDRLTAPQVTVVLFGAVVGVGVLSLPRLVASKAGVDSWIDILLAGLIAILIVSVISFIGTRYPEQSLIYYGPLLFGKWLGTLVLVIFLLYFLLFVGMVVRVSADVTKLFLLDLTPMEVIVIGLLSLSTYVVQHGINAIARFNELFQPLSLFLLLLVLTQTLRDADFGRLMPVLGDGLGPVLSGLPTTSFSFLGFEMLLFILPFMEKPKRSRTAAIVSLLFVTGLYTIVTVICIAVMGAPEVTLLLYPTLTVIKNIEVPGAFIERLDSIMMLVWIPFTVTTIMLYHYCASLIASQMFKLQEQRVISMLFFPVVFLIAVLPRNDFEVSSLSDVISWVGMAMTIFTPLAMSVVYLLKNRRAKS